MEIEFRRLVEDDLHLLHVWLNEPSVVRWWEGDDVSWQGVVRDYGPASDPRAEHWIAMLDGVPVGWIQCYATADHEEEDEVRHWRRLGIEATAAGIDYLVGDPAARGGGLGSAMIRRFVDDVVFGRHPAWTQACASPVAANVASVRALEKAGFVHVGTFEDEHGVAALLAKDRPAGGHQGSKGTTPSVGATISGSESITSKVKSSVMRISPTEVPAVDM